MIETKTIFTKKKKPPRHARPDEKKRKVKLERKRKKTLEHPQKHVRTLIRTSPASARPHSSIHTRVHPPFRTLIPITPSIHTSALIHTHTRPSAFPSKYSDARLTFLPADCRTESGSVLPPSAGFFSAHRPNPRPRTGSGGTASSSVERSKTKGKEDFRVDRTQ